jgi:hypothetical protein
MHVYVYYHVRMNLCIYSMYFSVYVIYIYIYIYIFTRFLCVYILIACSSKNLCGIAQLDARYATVCSVERNKVFSHVSWPDHGWPGKLHLIPT